ncbi:MAG: hypothetical protein K1X39_04210 [Thermoflexales bacterium]|nr:hypothetical protein [Thermoflexales bacterium]
MDKTFGAQSMIAPLRRVVVKRPDAAFGSADPARWHYSAPINLARAQAEHDAFCDQLRKGGAEVIYHDEVLPNHADSIFTFDPALVTDHGAVLLNMGKALRRGEEAAMGRVLQRAGVPILGALGGEAHAECGDMLWLDEKTLAIGQGYRTNAAAVAELRALLEPRGITILTGDLPYYTGPEACLHLLSLISIVDERLAVMYLPLFPVPLLQALERRGFRWVEVPEPEFLTQGPNVLATAPGECIMLEGNPITRQRLIDAGCEVQTYRGEELSFKAEGGATCLTRPILRGSATIAGKS